MSDPANQEKLRISKLKWKENNKEKILEAQRSKRENSREEYNRYMREYHQKNKAMRCRYINAHRRNRVKIATPIWADKQAIRQVYINCPKGYHVDHIIPLHGELVSGLHVLNNLQYLPANENLMKGNYFAIHEERS